MTTVQLETLKIADVRREPELQCRAGGTDQRTAQEYAAAMKAGAKFEPIVVFRDGAGVVRVGDGNHRLAAAELFESRGAT